MQRELPLWTKTECSCRWEKTKDLAPPLHTEMNLLYLCSPAVPVQGSRAWLWAGTCCFQNSVAFHKYHRKQLLNSKEQSFHMCSKGGWAGTAVAHCSTGRGCAGDEGEVCLSNTAASRVFLIIPWKHESGFCIALSVILIIMIEGKIPMCDSLPLSPLPWTWPMLQL